VGRENATSRGNEKLNPHQNSKSADFDKSAFSLTQKLHKGASVGVYPTIHKSWHRQGSHMLQARGAFIKRSTGKKATVT